MITIDEITEFHSLTTQWCLQGNMFGAVDLAVFLEVASGVKTFAAFPTLVRPISNMSTLVNRQSTVGRVPGVDKTDCD